MSKSKIRKRREAVTTDVERGDKMNARASRYLIRRGSQRFTKALAHAKLSEKELLKSINFAAAAGHDFILARGHQQLTFDQFGRDWFRSIEDQLSAELTLPRMKACVELAQMLPQPAKTIEECKSAMQILFEMADITAPSHRLGPQNSHERNLFSEMVTRVCGLSALTKKLEQAQPMDSWEPERLDEFIASGEPVEAQVRRAKDIRETRAKALPV